MFTGCAGPDLLGCSDKQPEAGQVPLDAVWTAYGDCSHYQQNLASAVQKVGQGSGHQTAAERECHVRERKRERKHSKYKSVTSGFVL